MLQFLMWINVKVFKINNKNKDVNSLILIKGMCHIGRLVWHKQETEIMEFSSVTYWFFRQIFSFLPDQLLYIFMLRSA